MKKLLIFSVIYLSLNPCIYSQEWKTIIKNDAYKYTPYNQFIINPYKNQLWFVQDENVSVIEPDGLIRLFGESELGDLWSGSYLEFTFTENSTYYKKDIYGLFSFNSFISVLEIDTNDIRKIRSNQDSVFVIRPFKPYFKYFNNQVYVTNKIVTDLCLKNNFLYADIGVIAQVSGPNSTDWNYLYTDPQYLQASHNYMCFSRNTDTFYLASKLGISFAYNYDFLDTITPNNTSNMPSPNVLEMEFDHLDRLWAVFGDQNDQAFSIAMLENDTWVNYYDANNSPIQFLHPTGQNGFYGLEIDTLGNVWVCDYANLHTLLNPNTPAWVGLKEVKTELIEVYPNPTKESVTIQFGNLKGEKSLVLLDIHGKKVASFETEESNFYLSLANLHKGIYFLEFSHDNERYHYKILKE